MTFLDFLQVIFSKTEQEKLDEFITRHNPQSVYDVESLTKRYDQMQHMQWFNNC